MVRTLFGGFWHVTMMILVTIAWWQVAMWYVNHTPVLGVDFFNTVSYVEYLGSNSIPIIGGWKNIWWMGQPVSGDYSTLHMFVMAPWAVHFGAVPTVLGYVAVMMWLFAIGCYWLFFEIGGDRFVSVGLSVAVVFSIGIYGAATWGGSLPYFATQIILPWTMYLIVKYLRTGKVQWLVGAGIGVGVSMWGHLLPGVITVSPMVGAMVVVGAKGGLVSRLRAVALFGVMVLLIGYVQLYFKNGVPIYALPIWLVRNVAGMVVNQTPEVKVDSTGGVSEEAKQYKLDIAKFNSGNLQLIVRETNSWLFLALGVAAVAFGIGLVVARHRLQRWGWLVMVIPLGYQLGYIWLYSIGISILHGGWYRVFWPVPVVVGMVVCAWWREFADGVGERTQKKMAGVVCGLLGVLCSGVLLVGVWQGRTDFLVQLDDTRLAYSELSSAWPMVVNYFTRREDVEVLRKLIKPEWMEGDTWQKRLYAADAQINIWWNYLFDLPTFRGYTDPRIGTSRLGGYFWWDVTAINDQLVETFKYPVEVAVENAKFLIDWYALHYIEAGPGASSYSALSSYLNNPDFIAKQDKRTFLDIPELLKYYLGKGELTLSSTAGKFKTKSLGMGEYQVVGQGISRLEWKNGAYTQWQVQTQAGEKIEVKESRQEVINYIQLDPAKPVDLKFKYQPFQEMNFYEFKPELTSLVLEPTNTMVMGVVGGDNFYESVMRMLALVNLNSKKVIPLTIRQPLDKLTSQDLKHLDVLMLYGYRGGNDKIWQEITDWVNRGGKLIVDTGGESPETSSSKLPNLFPIEKSTKKGVVNITSPINIDVTGYGGWVIDKQSWQFSVGGGTKSGEVWIEGDGQPLVVSRTLGQGQVVWSGLNLPYHANVSRVAEEARLFERMLNTGPKVSRSVFAGKFEVNRPNPQTVKIKHATARGVLFKEEDYGWKAYVNGKKAKIYNTGPAYPGFMYVPVQGDGEVKFVYVGGDLYEMGSYIVMVATLIWVVDWWVFGSRSFGKVNRWVLSKINGATVGWKDEDS